MPLANSQLFYTLVWQTVRTNRIFVGYARNLLLRQIENFGHASQRERREIRGVCATAVRLGRKIRRIRFDKDV